jgi:molybdopterin-containing oxidoreductase family iron-sulfur binding subunit
MSHAGHPHHHDHDESPPGEPLAREPLAGEPLDLETVRRRLVAARGPRFWRSLEELAGDPRFHAMVRREFPRQASEWIEPPGDVSRRNFLQLASASLALAGLTACTRQPLERIVPYVKMPEEIVPGRPLFYATAAVLGGYGVGLLAESHMGRPTKLDGNPSHPWSQGAADLHAQAAILNLYDPDRSQTVTYLGAIRDWNGFFNELQPALTAQQAVAGAGIRILTGSVCSPTLAAQIRSFLGSYPKASWHQWEASGRDAYREGMRRAFGEPLEMTYDLSKADVVLTLDSDLLASEPGAVRYARQFAARRRVRAEGEVSMNRLYAVESSPSPTGTLADHRLALPPSQIAQFVLALAAAVGAPGAAARQEAPWEKFAQAVAKDLLAAKGASLVTIGDHQPAALHALVHGINAALGNVGSTLFYSEPAEAEPIDQLASLRALVGDLDRGEVDVLLLVGANPVYDAPADFAFEQAIQKARLRVHFGQYADETAEFCHWQLPEAHFLETWGDVRALDGTLSIQQPLIEPLYGGKSAIEFFAALNGDRATGGMDLVKATWPLDDAAWRRALHDGLVPGSAAAGRSPALDPAGLAQAAHDAARDVSPEGSTLTLLFRPDPSLGDGRWANNGWLQECPKPVTKLTWDNALLIAPRTAKKLGLEHEAIAQVTAGSRPLSLPVWVLPGHAEDCATVHLGHGRWRAGRVGNGVGTNPYPARTSGGLTHVHGATVAATLERATLASTQLHSNIEDGEGKQAQNRGILRVATLAEFLRDPEVIREMAEPDRPELNIYPGFEYKGYAWGLAIDLNACTGCNACILACQSENNIPVVGKDQVAKGREMLWLRLDRYYSGDLDDPGIFNQPVMCMHCEQAPCESVCPVAATTHSTEGLNDMVYNRCVGTRYCANNCPYKVRRFNYFYYNGNPYNDAQAHPVLELMKNPDVTVRSRGVMEKCTYCVQRINRAKLLAEREERKVRDGEIRTACQQTCPTQAIVFGDVNDPAAEVSRWKTSQRNYGMLAEIATRPRTSYLARLRNPNPELETSA